MPTQEERLSALLYQALASPWGIFCATSDPNADRRRLYYIKSKCKDQALSGLAIRVGEDAGVPVLVILHETKIEEHLAAREQKAPVSGLGLSGLFGDEDDDE